MEIVIEPVRLEGFLVLLVLHTDVDPPVDEWDAMVASMLPHLERQPQLPTRVLVISDGGAPTRTQRKQLGQLFGNHPAKFSVVTFSLSSAIKRGIATVMRLLIPGYSFHRPEDFAAACSFLDLPPASIPVLTRELASMQTRMRPLKTMAALPLPAA